MNEKVKLPRNVIDTFRPVLDNPDYRISLIPISIVSDMYNRTLEGMTSDVVAWLNNYDNQWKLIDALRYGYEAEPEQLYYVRFTGNNGDFLNSNTETRKVFTGGHQEIYEYKAQFTMPEIIAIDPRYKAFAVPVDEVDGDMNKEGKADD